MMCCASVAWLILFPDHSAFYCYLLGKRSILGCLLQRSCSHPFAGIAFVYVAL